MLGSIRSKGRPLKFAFLVKPNDNKALLDAIELNSVLWGGPYNPIIPVFHKKTKRWRPDAFRKTAKDITLGYIRAFDPDFLVCDFEPPKYIKDLGIEVLRSGEILPTKEQPDRFSYGIGIGDILGWIYHEHFRFVQKFPIHVIFPIIPRRYAPFWASWFGKLPKEFLDSLLSSGYKKALDITTPKVKNLKKVLQERTLFPRRIMQHGLETQSRGGFSNENILFYMDPSDFLDIIDFWNLRAVGRSVLPAPINLKNDDFFKKNARNFIKSSQWTHRLNPSLTFRANIIPATSRTMEEARDFVTSLDLEKDTDGTLPLLMHHSYPRIWDDWARDKDNVNPHDVYFDTESESEIVDGKSRLTLPISIPEGIESSFSGNPKIANEVSYNVYGDLEKYAEVFPQLYGENLARSLDSVGRYREWRVGRNGLVRMVETFRSTSWELPLAEDVFSAWLRDNGWEYEASTSGMLSKELYKQIEGWAYGIADKKLIDLIEEMARSVDGEGRDKSVNYIKSTMRQIFGDDKRLEKFLELDLFVLGVNAQCPNCQRFSWYELEKLNKQLRCTKCLKEFKSIDSLSNGKWSYKTVGPLSVSNHADGAVCVVLSVDFFSERKMTSVQTTPVYSFNALKKSNKRKLEADFAFLWRESAYGEIEDGVAFGEAKTFNEFKKVDFDRMKAIAKDFPGAVLVFSTLREKLTDFEIEELKKIAKVGNKNWKADRPVNPVLILTGNELFSQHGPPYCWPDEEHNKYRDCRGILGLAKATQQKYLGIKVWDVVWHEEYEAKHKKALAKKAVQTKQ